MIRTPSESTTRRGTFPRTRGDDPERAKLTREAGRALIARWRALKTHELELLRELADLNVDHGARREYLIARENEAHRLQGRAARATLDAEKRRINETPVATGDTLLANTRAIGHVTVESRESYIRRKMAENGWDRQTAIAQATHLYPEEMDDLRAPWANRNLYTGEDGHSPDTAAQALHDEGRLAEPTADAFWDAVRGDIETIGKAKRRELDAAEAEAAAALAWGKERHDQTLAAIEMQDDAVGLGMGQERSSIGGLYSGGPTAYDRPSLRAIGTNDAGRAYGWGLYATTARDMAEGYAGATWRELANAFRFDGKTYAELTQDDPEAAKLIEGYAATAIAEKRARRYDPESLKRDLQRDRAWLADYLADPENAPENMDAYPQSKQDRLRRFQTRLQNVERLLQADIAMTERGIPAVHEQLWWTNRPDGDESHLLTWDARISEENRKRVINAVRSLGLTDAQLAEHFGAKWDSTPMTGEQAYGFVTEAIRDLAKLEGDHEALASQLLARHDVDGTVRHFPAGGSIYVAFSDEHLQVVRRWLWDDATQAFALDRSFTPPTPTMAEARATAGDDQAIAEAQASRSSIIGRIGARRLDWAGYRLTEDEHGTRRLVQGQDGRTLLEGLRDADAEVKASVGTDFTRGERARATRLSWSGPIRRDQVALAERWHRHETSENPETTSEDLAVRHWGWTLGKDGQWRLEIPYGLLRAGVPDALQTIAAENDAQASEAQSAALGDILEDEPLFAAYPELREAPVIPMPGDRDRWGRSVYGYSGNGTIVLFSDKLRDQVKLLGTLYHEIQHLIQHIEGFEGGEWRKVPTWSFYANAMGEAEARVAGASAMTPYGYDMDAYFRHALELTEGEIRDETGTWRRQTYDDLTLKAQRDKILRGQDDATQGILNQFANAKTLEALEKLAKKHLDVTAMTWGPKDGGGFEVTVEYDDDTIWWNTYGSEAAARDSMRRIFIARYANRTGDARSSIGGVNPAETSARQKDAHGIYPDASEDIARASIGARRQQEYRAIIAKHRPNLPQEEADRFMDELGKLGTAKAEKVALHWFVKGTIELPEDSEKLKQALSLAEKFKLDPLQFDSPLALAEEADRRNPKTQKPAYVDPDTVPELTNKRDLGHGVVVYDVEDSPRGQAAMRRIMNSHLGRDAKGNYWSPWCLLTPTVSGGVSESAKKYWKDYNTSGRGAAFYKGKLVAFQSSAHYMTEWWDMDDKCHGASVPASQKVSARELGWGEAVPEDAMVTRDFEVNEETGKKRIFGSSKAVVNRDGVSEVWVKRGNGGVPWAESIWRHKDGEPFFFERRQLIEGMALLTERKAGKGLDDLTSSYRLEKKRDGTFVLWITAKNKVYSFISRPDGSLKPGVHTDENLKPEDLIPELAPTVALLRTRGQRADVRNAPGNTALSVQDLPLDGDLSRSSIGGRRLSKQKPIEAMSYGARVGVFREAQRRPSNGSGIDEKQFVHVADLPPWAEELGLSTTLMANGRVLRKLAKKHKIDARSFAKLIEAIERPVAAFVELPEKNLGGRRRENPDVVLILEERLPERNGAPAPSSVVVLENREGYTQLITAYGLDAKGETKYVGAVNNGLMQWVDKERAKKLPLLAATVLALDSFNGASGPSPLTIANPTEEVKGEEGHRSSIIGRIGAGRLAGTAHATRSLEEAERAFDAIIQRHVATLPNDVRWEALPEDIREPIIRMTQPLPGAPEDEAKARAIWRSLTLTAALLAEGRSHSDLLRELGWTLGPDGFPRAELQPGTLTEKAKRAIEATKTSGRGRSITLGAFLDDPALFAAYPELRDLKVRIKTPGKLHKGVLGEASFEKGEIALLAASEQEILDSVYHETQHIIQNLEGFAPGDDASTGMDAYSRSMGEVEARAAGARATGEPGPYESAVTIPRTEMLTGGEAFIAHMAEALSPGDVYEADWVKAARDLLGFPERFGDRRVEYNGGTDWTYETFDDGIRTYYAEYRDDGSGPRGVHGREEYVDEENKRKVVKYYDHGREVDHPVINERIVPGQGTAVRSSIAGWFRQRQKRLRYAEELREDTARHAQAFAEGDRETAEALVRKHALRNGFIYEAWRGTNDFGRTNLGLRAHGVPNRRIFFAGSPGMAGTYTDDPTVREVGRGDQSGSGVYHVAIRFANPLAADAHGGTWSTVDTGDGRVVSTDDLSFRAIQEGYDGVVIRNVYDYNEHITHGEERVPGTVYVALDPTQVKSLDPFTFDDDGTLIPLDRRFDRGTPDIRSSIGGIERGAQAASLYFGRRPTYRDLNAKSLAEVALFATGKKQTRQKVAEAYASFGVSVTPETAAVIADRINADLEEQRNARRSRLKPGEQPRDRAFGLVDALAKAYDTNWAEAQKEAFSKGVAGTFGAAREMAEEAQALMEARRQEAEAVTGTAPAILEAEMGFDIEATLLAAPEPSPRATGRRRRSPRHFTRTPSSCEMAQTSRTTTRACESCMTRRRLSLAGRIGRGDGMDSEKTSEQRGHRVYSLESLELEEARQRSANTASTALPRTRDLTSTVAKPGRGSQPRNSSVRGSLGT